MTTQPPPTGRKPKWLRKLEQESWQAELIVSGAAIIGSLQLPGLVDSMEYYFLLNYDRDTLFICYLSAIYWRILAVSLIFAFIFHFIVRALWIGLVGLNSVFPGGFRTNQRFSPYYQAELRNEYGDIDGFIARLDRLGSAIFGVAFATAGVFLNFGLIGLLFIFIHSWLIGYGLAPRQVLWAIGALVVPLFTLSVLLMISHAERFRESSLVRRFQWPLSMLVSRFTYPLSRRYIVTATNLVVSYSADHKRLGWSYLLMIAILIGVMMVSLREPR